VATASGYERERVERKQWMFLTHHAQVLLAIARDPSARVNEIAEATRITERYAYHLLSDLQKAGYIRRRRDGRRNRYEFAPDAELGDPVIEEQPLRRLLTLLSSV
jgi:DNA-binding MarR family transcriptional regulator